MASLDAALEPLLRAKQPLDFERAKWTLFDALLSLAQRDPPSAAADERREHGRGERYRREQDQQTPEDRANAGGVGRGLAAAALVQHGVEAVAGNPGHAVECALDPAERILAQREVMLGADLEADVAQLDINEQFALFFPELRPFFLEGAPFFDTRIRAVHTRNLADPNWGVKLTGQEGRHGIGVLAVEDATTNLLLPGPESSEVETIEDESLAAVARYRLDVGEASTVGMLFTGREATDYRNIVAGVDGNRRHQPGDPRRQCRGTAGAKRAGQLDDLRCPPDHRMLHRYRRGRLRHQRQHRHQQGATTDRAHERFRDATHALHVT